MRVPDNNIGIITGSNPAHAVINFKGSCRNTGNRLECEFLGEVERMGRCCLEAGFNVTSYSHGTTDLNSQEVFGVCLFGAMVLYM